MLHEIKHVTTIFAKNQTMNFTNFTNDVQANNFLNQLYYLLQINEQNIGYDLSRHILLSGRSSAILQNQPEIPLQNVIFVVNDDSLLSFIRKGIANELRAMKIHFTNRSVFQTPNIVVEFWKNTGPSFTSVQVNGFNCQLLSEIPPITL